MGRAGEIDRNPQAEIVDEGHEVHSAPPAPEVFERDGWVCGICGQLIDPVLKWPEPRSASLDHVLPLAAGGEHTRANTQAAHLICNIRKGARTSY